MLSENPASSDLLRRCTLFVNFEWPEVETGPKMLSSTFWVCRYFYGSRWKFSEQWKWLHGLCDVSAVDFSFQAECTINGWMDSAGKACPHTMTADKSEAGELALEPLLTCKLCLCEYSLDKMTTLQECSCIFCTAVRSVNAFTLQKQGNGRWTELWDGIACLVQEVCVTHADIGCFSKEHLVLACLALFKRFLLLFCVW